MNAPLTPEALVEAPYVLLKRGLFYGPNNQGYTGVLRKAGRYTREDAEARADHCAPAVTMMLASEAPDYAPACWHETQVADLLDLLRIEREARGDAEAALATADAELAHLRAEGEAKDRALKLCLAELDWQVSAAEHCGDPDRECPMQDIGKPCGEHAQARDAARTALARAATAREGA